ncbi:small subunit ribosomal protein MRP21 [Geosmithia morbida]|uniref:Small subunit ribosomal protein MRP21 n=1 Tax=Geosmithia morbida TaxID=1094350 RepID=A0A9P4YVU4_9HYPO|nr:small subunit ribosomal protein MRP21 [Geosmithia morbida]KAF4122965.1 small subunit ribosomal protein MRP21 [Geosmithia morbida]
MLLSWAIRPAAFSAPLAIRTFSTTSLAAAAGNGPARKNPLIGSNTHAAASPVQEKPTAPASTEQAATPPPPPPPAATIAAAAAETQQTETKSGHAYDAATSASMHTSSSPGFVDIAKLLDNHAAAYARSVNKTTDPLNQPRVRCTPVTGRTVFLEGNPRLPGTAHSPDHAFNLLRRVVRTGQIKTLWHRQRFHERPGLRRKRLKSERWRSRFKQGFQAAAVRVRELKKQGW